MAIRHKRKTTTGYAWQTTDLVDGQLGINTTDGTLHCLNAAGSAVHTIKPASAINFSSDGTGTLPIAKGGTGQTTKTAAMDALAPTTTKGDLIVHNGTDNIRVGVGTDAQVLTADSTAASGVKWATAAGGSATIPVLIYSYNTAFSTDRATITVSGTAWNATLLNTEVVDTNTNGSLATNTVTLQPGKYLVDFTVHWGSTDANPAGLLFRVRNTSDNTNVTATVGSISTGGSSGSSMTSGTGYINIASAKNIQLQHILNGASGSYYVGSKNSSALDAGIGNREHVQLRFVKIG